jgi:hypothetical protein
MRNYILQQYTSLSKDSIVIGHHGSCHTRIFFQTLLWILLLWISYTAFSYFLPWYISIITWIIWWIWILLYLHFVVEFLNKYLDACIITTNWITIFEREWFLHYTSQQFEWETIESISHSQNSLSDKILYKWSITITIEHDITFIIDNLSNPQQLAQRLWKYKQDNTNYNHQLPISDNEPWSHEKFDILVETLWEVIKDYMWKQQQLPHKKREL